MDNRRSALPPRRPLSVTEIAKEAEKYDFNTNIPLKHWVGAAETLYREGTIYKEEGNYAKAYLLLLRHCTLVLDRFPTHPAAKSPDGKRQVRRLNERIPKILAHLEEIKPHITLAYKEWEKLSKAGRVGEQPAEASRYDTLAAKDAALSWNKEAQAHLLDAAKNQELAISLAKDDYRRRDARRRSTRQAGISDEEEQARRTGGLWDMWDHGSESESGGDGDDLQRRLQDTRRRLDDSGDQSAVTVQDFSARNGYNSSGAPLGASNLQAPPSRPPPPSYRQSPSYHYPSITRPSGVQYDPSLGRRSSDTSSSSLTTYVRRPSDTSSASAALYPPRPSKERLPSSTSSSYEPHPRPPPIPGKVAETESLGPSPQAQLSPVPPRLPPKTGTPEPPQNKSASVDKAITDLSKRKNITFLPAAYTEGGQPLRPIFLPKRLKDSFLDIARPNTKKGLELCGILCGRPINNALFVAALLIPSQVCTTDTCETEDEYQIYDFCEKENMIMIGWIHTHPTQTCFMSSRDLHTHAGYQAISPEAIAIVCAPKYEPSFGVFRLTDPPGLPHILRCPHTNTFHQHDLMDHEIYRDATHPTSHVYLSDQIEFDIADLRNRP